MQEEFNLRGALVAAQAIEPDIAIQIDLMLATDTPDMRSRGDLAPRRRAGHEPLQLPRSRHAERHDSAPGARLSFQNTAREERLALQRSAQVGVLTDSSYVQLVHRGVAAIDLGFPCRYTHSALEVCDVADLEALASLLVAALPRIGREFSLDPRRLSSNESTISASTSALTSSKGALVGADGTVLATAVRSHQLIVPQAGWAEHRAEEDWWGDFVWLARRLIAGQRHSAVRNQGA